MTISNADPCAETNAKAMTSVSEVRGQGISPGLQKNPVFSLCGRKDLNLHVLGRTLDPESVMLTLVLV